VPHTFSVDRKAALAACSQAYHGHGKLEVLPKFNVNSLDDIATLYTPGVAFSVQEIIARPEAIHELSIKLRQTFPAMPCPVTLPTRAEIS
jgi:malic enzyme